PRAPLLPPESATRTVRVSCRPPRASGARCFRLPRRRIRGRTSREEGEVDWGLIIPVARMKPGPHGQEPRLEQCGHLCEGRAVRRTFRAGVLAGHPGKHEGPVRA